MFDNLTHRLSRTIESLRGRGRITEENVGETLREARVALLEADVALPVVKSFIEAVKAKALGAEVLASLTPGQAFIGILHSELVALMGGAAAGLQAARPAAGGGAAGGPAGRRQDHHRRQARAPGSSSASASACCWSAPTCAGRPPCCSWSASPPRSGPSTCRQTRARPRRRLRKRPWRARRSGVFDVLIVDTAGRLHVDEALMAEVREIDAAVGAAERLFVVDAMAGQDAVNAARAFGAALELTGIILTKADGDARGGAALSVRQITGKPIVFVGVGREDRGARALRRRAHGLADPRHGRRGEPGGAGAPPGRSARKPSASPRRWSRARASTCSTCAGSSSSCRRWGVSGPSWTSSPGVAKKSGVSADQGDRDIRRQIAIINSMTPRERRNPAIIDGSRRRRIAGGSGVQVQDVNRLLKQFLEMQRVMKSMKGGALKRMMGAFKGGMPPGFPGGR